MIYVYGSIGIETPERVDPVIQSTHPPTGIYPESVKFETIEGGSIAYSNATVDRTDKGRTSALLFRPLAERATSVQDALDHLAESCARGERAAVSAISSGPFLLVLADAAQRTVTLATDVFAICRLHYRRTNKGLIFSSDLATLISHPEIDASLDPQAIYNYVFFHHIPSPRTIYKGVSKLGPASALTCGPGLERNETYWLPSFTGQGGDPSKLGPDLHRRLQLAVSQRANERSGAFLSGGLDSSTISGLLKEARGTASTFTIGFDAAGYDESGYAQIAAERFGTKHHEYFVKPSDVLEALPMISMHLGEPFGNSSVIPAYYCARFAREHGVELMFAGDGGDELFAGNTRYTDQRIFEHYFKASPVLRAMLDGIYRRFPALETLPLTRKGAGYIKQAKMGLPDRLQAYNFLHRFDPAKVFDRDWLSTIDTDEPWHAWRARYAEPESGDSLQRMLYLDWKFTLADNDLVKVGNMCALAGVDVCYPMLDREVVEFSTTLCADDLLFGGRLRGFYKHAFRDYLPAELLNKSKHGFGLPFGVWMRNDADLKALSLDTFGSLSERGILSPAFLSDAMTLHSQDSAGYYGELVWVLLMLELWLGARSN